MPPVAHVIRVQAETPDPDAIREAADFIRRGRVVAFPTDTVYGLAVDPRSPVAVKRLYALKGRAETSALTLIASDLAQVRAVGEMTEVGWRLAERWWPGPLTIVVTARPVLAAEMLAGGSTVGLRIPDHGVAVALSRAAGFAVTATSANRSGEAAAVTPSDVMSALPGLDAIVDAGPAPGGAPSTIVDVSAPRVALIREGAVPWSKVLESLQ